MNLAALSVDWPVIVAVAGMFVTILGALLHVIYKLGHLVEKVENLERDMEDLRRYVFPVPHLYRPDLTPQENT